MFTLCVRDTPASSVKHPLFPLCVSFEIVPDNLFGVVILFYPLSSTTLPIFICLTSMLHTTLVRSFSISFSQIFDSFVEFLSGCKRMIPTPKLWCPLCIHFVIIGQWDRAFSQCVVMHNVIFVPIQHFSFQDWMPRMLIKFRVHCNRDFVGFQSSREDATSFCPRLQPS